MDRSQSDRFCAADNFNVTYPTKTSACASVDSYVWIVVARGCRDRIESLTLKARERSGGPFAGNVTSQPLLPNSMVEHLENAVSPMTGTALFQLVLATRARIHTFPVRPARFDAPILPFPG